MIYVFIFRQNSSDGLLMGATKEDIIKQIRDLNGSGDNIYTEDTGRDWLENSGSETIAEARRDDELPSSWIDLIEKHGLDAKFYMVHSGDLTVDPPFDEFTAHIEWIGRDSSATLVFMSEEEALAELEKDWMTDWQRERVAEFFDN